MQQKRFARQCPRASQWLLQKTRLRHRMTRSTSCALPATEDRQRKGTRKQQAHHLEKVVDCVQFANVVCQAQRVGRVRSQQPRSSFGRRPLLHLSPSRWRSLRPVGRNPRGPAALSSARSLFRNMRATPPELAEIIKDVIVWLVRQPLHQSYLLALVVVRYPPL